MPVRIILKSDAPCAVDVDEQDIDFTDVDVSDGGSLLGQLAGLLDGSTW